MIRKLAIECFWQLSYQPAFVELKKQNPDAFRVIGDLSGADRIMNSGLFLGVYPGLSVEQIEFIINEVHYFCKNL